MKLYYVANARMPSEKAHGIQIAKMCEAFIEAGIDLTLVVPARTESPLSLREQYGLRTDIPLVRLPVPDWYKQGRVGFALSSLFFIAAYSVFLLTKKIKKETFVLYTVDMDTLAHTPLPLFGKTVAEMHSPKKGNALSRFFFMHAERIVATNNLIGAELIRVFAIPREKVIIQPNGVDFKNFDHLPERSSAREEIGMFASEQVALYVGRLISWKGMEVLPEAAAQLPASEHCYVVGGTKEELESLTGQATPTQLTIMGERPFSEIPLWLRSADVGIVLGTAKNESSYRYTSPMKVFEYMAAKLPIVASRTPALADILSDDEAFFFEPDNAASLAEALHAGLSDREEASRRAARAYEKARRHSWEVRATRVLANLPSSHSMGHQVLRQIGKFLATGCIGLSVNLLALQLLVKTGVQYLLASMVALSFSTVVGFLLQRFWTFEYKEVTGIYRQFFLYVLVVGINLIINTAIVYGCVEYAHMHYLIAQFIGAGVVAFSSYFMYHLYIFRPSL